MADVPTTTPQAQAPIPPDTGGQEPAQADEVAKWKAMSRKWEGQAKSNADAAQRLAAYEDAQKTEAQKAAERIAALERDANEARTKALRYEVGVEKGVPTKLLRYLTGATKEELEANAEQLLADFGPDTGASAQKLSSRPKEALRPGASPAAASPEPSQLINDNIRQAARRRVVNA